MSLRREPQQGDSEWLVGCVVVLCDVTVGMQQRDVIPLGP